MASISFNILNNYTAVTAPTVSDDLTFGYEVGSAWLDTSMLIWYLCADASSGSAIWTEFESAVTDNLTAIVAPTATDDISLGYEVGSLWFDTITGQWYICSDNSTGAAVWFKFSPYINNNFSAIVAPTVTDDSSMGYEPSAMWFDTVLDEFYILLDSTIGAAVWLKLSTAVNNNFGAIVPPTNTDDGSLGYEVGSMWFDTVTELWYINNSAAVGSAVWFKFAPYLNNNFGAVVAPTVTDDASAGYEESSLWYNTLADDLYVLVDATTGAAVWLKVQESVNNNFTAIVAPSVTDDSSMGYEPSSQWYNTTTGILYILVNSAVGAAVWKAVSSASAVTSTSLSEDYYYVEHFVGTLNGSILPQANTASGGASVVKTSAIDGHNGIRTLRTGSAVAVSTCQDVGSGAESSFFFNDGITELAYIFRPPLAAVNAANNHHVCFGFTQFPTSNPITQGVFFDYDFVLYGDHFFRAIVRRGALQVVKVLPIALTGSSLWTKMGIKSIADTNSIMTNTRKFEFYCGDTSNPYALGATITELEMDTVNVTLKPYGVSDFFANTFFLTKIAASTTQRVADIDALIVGKEYNVV